MKTRVSIKKFLFLLAAICMVLPCSRVSAATGYSITYTDVSGNTLSASTTVTSGSAIGTLPSVTDLIAWVDADGRVVDESTVPASDLALTAITTDDVSANGTLDSGNIIWFILDNKLFVTGEGTITIAKRSSTSSTKSYGISLSSIDIAYPAIAEDWITAPAVGDEQSSGFGSYTKPSSDSYSVDLGISRSVDFTGQTINYPASALADAAPWLDYAADITEITFTNTVSLSGNFTLYFNQNSASVTPGTLNESVYSSLETIYMFADTSAVSSMSAMYARCPALESVYIKAGSSYDTGSCTDISAMFFGDELLTCTDTADYGSIINYFSDTGSITDMRYAFFDCKSISKPAIGTWDVSNVSDFSYAFTGCNSARLTCGASTDSSDLQDWDMGSAYSTVCMFAGADIDISQENPVMDLWGYTDSSVIDGTFDLSKWDLGSLQVAVYMFAQNASLTDVIWSGSVPLLTDASAMFAWDSGLSLVDFSGLNTASLQYADTMFFSAGADSSTASFDGWDISQLRSAEYMFYGAAFRTLDFDNTNPSSLVSATGMFENCTSLASLGTDALSSWTLSGLESADYMFEGDAKLTSLDVSGWGMDAVTTLAYFVSGCSTLGSLDTSGWNISGALTDISCFAYGSSLILTLDMHTWDISGVRNAFYAFGKMLSLKTVDISGWNPAALENAYGMFAYDYSLQAVDWGSASAPNLTDAGGMYINNISLASLYLPDLITDAAVNLSYFASGCSNVSSLDISGWDTGGAEYMQCMFNGMESLADITFGTDFSTAKAVSLARILKNDSSLSNSSLQGFLSSLSTGQLVSAYEMMYNCANLTNAEIGGLDFSAVENISRMFYRDNSLSVITLPASFGVSASEKENVFFCDTDTLTYLTVNSSSLPAFISGYDWDADNRIFLIASESSIDGVAGNTYEFGTDGVTSVQLQFTATPTLYLQSVPADVSYSWTYGTDALDNSSNTYTVTRSGIGSYTCTASLTDVSSAASVSGTFTVTRNSGITGLTAVYSGADIPIGETYSTDDVTVTVTRSSGGDLVLGADEYTVSGSVVTQQGDNTFTAYYTDEDNNQYSAEFTVTGIHVVDSVTAVYLGPDVAVGNDYDSGYVQLTAYYADDTDKTDGFSVTPTSFSSQTVSSVGTNTFTAYYTDTATGTTLSADFTVTGYESTNISSVTAEYSGSDIVVGETYDTADVTVTITYSDGTPDLVTDSFTVNSQVVSAVGTNTFTAYYTAPDGTVYPAQFTVTGVLSASVTTSNSDSSDSTSSLSVTGVQTGDNAKIIGTILIICGLVLILGILLYVKYYRKTLA